MIPGLLGAGVKPTAALHLGGVSTGLGVELVSGLAIHLAD
jgi:hypothetical protein